MAAGRGREATATNSQMMSSIYPSFGNFLATKVALGRNLQRSGARVRKSRTAEADTAPMTNSCGLPANPDRRKPPPILTLTDSCTGGPRDDEHFLPSPYGPESCRPTVHYD